jgi:hypothetical protein
MQKMALYFPLQTYLHNKPLNINLIKLNSSNREKITEGRTFFPSAE